MLPRSKRVWHSPRFTCPPATRIRPAKPSSGSEPWRVGVLFSRTGVMAVIEQTQLKATLLAIDEINESGGVGGREIVPLAYDPGSDSRQFAHYAMRLLVEDEITTIFGCYTS